MTTVQHPTRGEVEWSTLSELDRVLYIDQCDVDAPQPEVVKAWHTERTHLLDCEIEDQISAAMAARGATEHALSEEVGEQVLAMYSLAHRRGKQEYTMLTEIASDPADHFKLRKAWTDTAVQANKALSAGQAAKTLWWIQYGDEARIVAKHEEKARDAMDKRHQEERKQFVDRWTIFREMSMKRHTELVNKIAALDEQARQRMLSNEHLAFELRSSRSITNIGFSEDLADGSSDEERGTFHLNPVMLKYITSVVMPVVVEMAMKDEGVINEFGQREFIALKTHRELLNTLVRGDPHRVNLYRIHRMFVMYNKPVPMDWVDKVGWLVNTAVCHKEFYQQLRAQAIKVKQEAFLRMQAEAKQKLEAEGKSTGSAPAADNTPDNGPPRPPSDTHTDSQVIPADGVASTTPSEKAEDEQKEAPPSTAQPVTELEDLDPSVDPREPRELP